MTTLTPIDLQGVLPHRGVNLFLDEVRLLDSEHSVSTTVVPAGDERELLGRMSADGRMWNEPFLYEMLALTGIPLIHEQLAAEGKVAVFSAMSRKNISGGVRMDRPVEALATITRNRGVFVQFGAEIKQDGQTLMTGEIMSGGAAMSEITAVPVRPPTWSDPGEDLVADFSFKAPSMRFIDGVEQWDAASGLLRCRYTYPDDHPFVPGHFPDAPLMMGVTQVEAVIDALREAAARLDLPAVRCSGSVQRPDGSAVLDVRDLELVDGVVRSGKRAVFREPVRPGDGLIVELTVAPC